MQLSLATASNLAQILTSEVCPGQISEGNVFWWREFFFGDAKKIQGQTGIFRVLGLGIFRVFEFLGITPFGDLTNH